MSKRKAAKDQVWYEPNLNELHVVVGTGGNYDGLVGIVFTLFNTEGVMCVLDKENFEVLVYIGEAT